MKRHLALILCLLMLGGLLASCNGKSQEEETPAQPQAAPGMTTFNFEWEAICRCFGETAVQGKLCSGKGTYTGQHATEAECVEKMKAIAAKELNCKENQFLTFRYEAQ